MSNKYETYYYKCGLGIGFCDKVGKERIDKFVNYSLKDKKKFKWISKQNYVLRHLLLIFMAIIIFPLFLILFFISKIIESLLDICYNFFKYI